MDKQFPCPMRLELADFRGYQGHHVLDARSGEITHLKGLSAAGKTTLFRAIEWILFGDASLLGKEEGEPAVEGPKKRAGRAQKGTWASLSWSAEERLDRQPLHIYRAQGKNKIRLQQGTHPQLEGESAQGQIVLLFGTEALWKSSSYLRQRERCALLEMTKKADILAELGHLAYGIQTSHCGQGTCMSPDLAKTKIDLFLTKTKKAIDQAETEYAKRDSVRAHFAAHHGLAEDEAIPEATLSDREWEALSIEKETAERRLASARSLTPWLTTREARQRGLEDALAALPTPLPTASDVERARRVGRLLGEWEQTTGLLSALAPVSLDGLADPGPAPPAPRYGHREVALKKQWEEEEAVWSRLNTGVYTPSSLKQTRLDLGQEKARRSQAARLEALRASRDTDLAELERVRPHLQGESERVRLGHLYAKEWITLALTGPDDPFHGRLSVALARQVLNEGGGKPGKPNRPTALEGTERSLAQLEKVIQQCALGSPSEVAERIADLTAFLDAYTMHAKNKQLDQEIARLCHVSEFALSDLEEQRKEVITRASYQATTCPCCREHLVWTGSALEKGTAAGADRPNTALIELDGALRDMRRDLARKASLERQRVPEDTETWGTQLDDIDTAGMEETRAELAMLIAVKETAALFGDRPDRTADEVLARQRTRLELSWWVDRDAIRTAFSGSSSERVKETIDTIERRLREADQLERALSKQENRFPTWSDADLDRWSETLRGLTCPVVAETERADLMAARLADLERWTMQHRQWTEATVHRDRRTALETKQAQLKAQLAEEGEHGPTYPSTQAWTVFTAKLAQALQDHQRLSTEKTALDGELELRKSEWLTLTATPWPTPLEAFEHRLALLKEEWVRETQKRERALIRTHYAAHVTASEEKKKELVGLQVQLEHAKSLKKLAEVIETRLLDQIVMDLNASLETLCEPLFEDPVTVYITLTKQNASNEGMRTSFDVHMIRHDRDIIVKEVSGGEGDRISFALALALADLPMLRGNPLLLFDETMTGLDPDRREWCVETLKTFAQQRPWKSFLTIEQNTVEGMYDTTLLVEKSVEGWSSFREAPPA